MIKTLTASIALASLVALPAAADPKLMSHAMLDEVVAGTYYPPCPDPEPVLKGNNGWGNGADPTNPGSFSGKTSFSKTANGSVPGQGRPNINPTTSTGR